MSTSSIFQYRPLYQSRREIRLVQFVPSRPPAGILSAIKELWRQTVTCRIVHASLNDNSKYWALSYVWGSSGRRRTIELNGKPFEVTENLEEALQYLATKDHVTSFWIDAICINQLDEEEKSWQIQQMVDIYREAELVLIWLGRPWGISTSDMDELKRIGSIATSTMEELVSSNGSDHSLNNDQLTMGVKGKALQMAYEKLRLNDSTQKTPFPIGAIYSLMERSWWHRVWVMQELAVSQMHCFVCGRMMILGDELQAALELFRLWCQVTTANSLGGLELNYAEEQTISRGFDRRPYLMMEKWQRLQDHEFLLEELLRDISLPSTKFEATNPKDRVYAMLGLASDRGELDITPDYCKSCAEVYSEAAKAMICAKGSVNLLSLCQESKLQDGLPSWTPDWSHIIRSELQRPEVGMSSPFAASAGLGSQLTMEYQPKGKNLLRLRGVRVDKICKIGSTWTGAQSSQMRTRKDAMGFITALTEWCSGVITTATNSNNSRQLAWRTVMTDRVTDRVGRLSRLPVSYKFDSLEELFGNDPVAVIGSEDLTPVFSMIKDFAEGRRSFATADGSLGIGPEQLRTYDIVVVLFGADVPFVMREHNGYFELVGEAYVDGIMDGQVSSGKHNIEDFLLR